MYVTALSEMKSEIQMRNAVDRTASSLLRKERVSLKQYHQLVKVTTPEEMCQLACTFYKAGGISVAEHDQLVRAVRYDQSSEAMTRKKAKMAEIDRYSGGRRGRREAQGGLPSLGKRQ